MTTTQESTLQEQQLRESMLCCPMPTHRRLLSYFGMWDLDVSSDAICI